MRWGTSLPALYNDAGGLCDANESMLLHPTLPISSFHSQNSEGHTHERKCSKAFGQKYTSLQHSQLAEEVSREYIIHGASLSSKGSTDKLVLSMTDWSSSPNSAT